MHRTAGDKDILQNSMGDMQELEKIVAPAAGDDTHGKQADPYLMREAWLQIVKPVANAGRLDKIAAQKPLTKKQKHVAQVQNYHLTRATYAMPDGYSRIQWNSTKEK